MRKLIVSTFLTLDGVMQAPGGPGRTQDLRYLRRIFAHAPEEAGAKPLNDATRYVASRSHPTLKWSKSVLIEGDATEGIAGLKKEDGPPPLES